MIAKIDLMETEEFYAFILGLRSKGVAKCDFRADGFTLDLYPDHDALTLNIDPTVENKKQSVRDAIKTAEDLAREEKEDLEWSI